MSGEIENAIFSADEGAGWTGLGQVIPAAISKDPDAMAALCGANFEVLKRPCYYKDTAGQFRAAEGRDVLIRSDNGAMLEVVSDNRYHVEHRQPRDIFAAFRDQLHGHGLSISHAATLRGGSYIAVCARLPDADISVGAGDKVKTYLTLSTGYDKKNGTKKTVGGVRVVCMNTLQYSIREAIEAGKLATIRASTRLEETTLAEFLKAAFAAVDDQKRTYDALANTRISDADIRRYFADVLEIDAAQLGVVSASGKKLISTKSENMLATLAAAYGNAPGAAMATGTLWGAVNAVTYYATHQKTVRDTCGDGAESARVASNLYGDAAKLKSRALELAAARLVAVAA